MTTANTQQSLAKKTTDLKNSVSCIEKIMSLVTCRKSDIADEIDRINLDIFTVYSLNSLYWMYLRTKGIDPNTNEIKHQLSRIKDYMIKSKQAHDRKTLRPVTSAETVKRIVRHYTKDSANDGPQIKRQRT